MRRPTALLIPSPWSGDEHDPTPSTYWWWFRLYWVTRHLRHFIGLHDFEGNWVNDALRCTWCGKVRRSGASAAHGASVDQVG